MKRTIVILASIFALSVFSSTNTLQAQHISVNINIGSQPAWGPVGYDYVDFYYMPEINCYYNVSNMLFYYLDRGRWVGVRYLPTYYSRYDMYTMYKVVINGSHNPWRYNNRHRNDYYRYASYHNQPVIRYSQDRRYSNSRRNQYDWVENGRNLHNRNNAGRGTSENRDRYSSGRGSVSTREASATTDRNSVGRGSSNISTREATSGRSSNATTRETNSRNSNSRTSTRNYDSSSGRGANTSSGRESGVSSRGSQGSDRSSSSNSRNSSSRSSDSRSSEGRTSSGR